MQTLNFVQSLLNQNQLIDNLAFTLRPGQMISGKVTKLFPNQIAEVLVGSHKVIAQLETPLSVNERHWFQVQPGEGKVHLRVLETKSGNGTVSNIETALKELSLPISKENASLLEYLQNKQLPITKETMQIASDWLKDKTLQDGLKIIDIVFSRQLPFTKNVLNSLFSFQEDEPISAMLDKLQTQLKGDNKSTTTNRLLSLIDQLRNTDYKTESPLPLQQNSPLADTNMIKEHIKQAIKSIGFSYENETTKLVKDQEAGNDNKMEALKPLLLRLLSEEASAPVKNTSERLLNKITGFQVLSQDAGQIQQLVFQIPLTFWDKRTDLTMHWSGRKNENGQIDSNFCRILFYLSLDHIKETIVDLHVQNRVISISIMNYRKDLKEMAQMYIPTLKENLAKFNYHLTGVQFENLAEKNSFDAKKNKTISNLKLPNNYSGVDFRI